MDIGHNLFYNENTVHSGNFLEEPAGFGKETMRNKIKKNMLIFLVCILLCGCTRREQLILEDISSKGEPSVDLRAAQGQGESGTLGLQEQDAAETQGVREQSTSGDGEQQQTIFVHVCGAVKKPDVYELPTGSRVYEAVQKAGGFTENADESYVNQAQILSDGVKLVIPTLEQTQVMMSDEEEETLIGVVEGQGNVVGLGIIAETPKEGSEASQGSTSDGKININTASEAELCNIPGIGATRAAAIVAYRQEKGGFSSIEDIMNVSGIKEGTYEKIKDSITIN